MKTIKQKGITQSHPKYASELKTLQVKTSQYNLDMQRLNVIDIAIFRKHKKLIKDFNSTISILDHDINIADADTKEIPEGKEKD